MVLKGSVKAIAYTHLTLFEKKKKTDVMNHGFLNIKTPCLIFS